MTLARTETGLLLLGLSLLSFGFWLMPLEALLSALGLAESLLASEFSEFLINTVLSCPAIALAVAGLIICFRGREAFWKTANKRYSVQLVLLLIGIILVVLGASLALLTYQTSVYYSGKPTRTGKTLTEYLFRNMPYFIWFGLWIIAGVALLLDFFAHERTDKWQLVKFAMLAHSR